MQHDEPADRCPHHHNTSESILIPCESSEHMYFFSVVLLHMQVPVARQKNQFLNVIDNS